MPVDDFWKVALSYIALLAIIAKGRVFVKETKRCNSKSQLSRFPKSVGW
jgi:hypothetical protein